jgi:predicted nucleic acid-binding protein
MMNVSGVLQSVKLLFLDTAPVIYYVEKNPRYIAVTDVVFNLIDQNVLPVVTSPITLAECLVYPYRQANRELQQRFTDVLIHGVGTRFVGIDATIGGQAAELRARYNLSLPDALQFACALSAGCDAFLSNDIALKRVLELSVVILDELVV